MNLYEKKVIGGVLSGAIKAEQVALHAGDWSELGEVFTALKQIEAEKLPPSPELLASRLAASESFYTSKDFDLMAKSAQSASVAFEAIEKIKANALQTFLTAKLSDLATDEKKTGAEMLDALKEIIARADRNYKTSENNFVWLKDIAPKLEAVYSDLHNGVTYAVSTGFDRLDSEILDGFSKGDLHIIAGMTGNGKSALALQCARAQAERGIIVGAVSREMSDIENAMRLQCGMQAIPRWQIRSQMFDTTYEDLLKGIERLAKLPIAFDVRTEDVTNLRIQARRMVEQYEMKILYVDYLQLVRDRKESRAEEVAAVSRTLKLVAMENNIPVVALSQFNRSAMNASKFDLLSHLKESSGIEQDASTIVLVQLEQTEQPTDSKAASLTILKNRNGATFKPIDLRYNGPTFTFSL